LSGSKKKKVMLQVKVKRVDALAATTGGEK